MYFSKDKSDTNIDDEFKKDNILSRFIDLFSKFKIIIFILIVIVMIIVMIFVFTNKKINNYLVLMGEESITLYQGMDYVEPGYDAYNSKEENLNNDVVIDYNVDVNAVGEYEIIYMLGDIVKIRKVSVVERPEIYTSIYLKPVNNSINVYLKLGDKYEEPGYQVFSSADIDLSDKVNVSGSVDTSKKGNYVLTYSVTDQNGVTITATRLVIVMDSEISISLNTKDATNKDVIINIGVIDNYFDYMILPNGMKIEDSTYSYRVIENGKYTFKVYNIKGDFKEKSIEVKNIDRIVPTGSCEVSHIEDGSVISIKANDSNGISKYVYNGIEYKNNIINLKEHIKDNSIIVTFYDGVGNSGNAECLVPEIPNFNDDSSDDKETSSNGSISSLSIKTTYVDVTDLSCTIIYGKSTVTKKIAINSEIADEFHSILGSVCNYVNSSSLLDNLQHAGAYVNREITETDYHSRGLAIDLNNLWSFTYNGKTYRPYASQGINTWNNYNKFICEVCDGNENCKYNVNYIIFNRYFKPKGWCWGGNFSPKYFDPMHFELRDNSECPTSYRGQLSCD